MLHPLFTGYSTAYFLHRHRDRIHRSSLSVLLHWHYHLILWKRINQVYGKDQCVVSYRAMRRNFFKEILPVSSSSNNLKAFNTSSRESRWRIISAATATQTRGNQGYRSTRHRIPTNFVKILIGDSIFALPVIITHELLYFCFVNIKA